MAAILALALAWVFMHASFEGNDFYKYDPIIEAAAARHGVPPSLVKAIIWRESNFRPDVRGKAGEIGLMQLMPCAVDDWTRVNKAGRRPSEKELFNPELNIEIGAWYLSWTGRHWDGYKSRELLQISEYNAGYGGVTKNWKPALPDDELRPEDIKFSSTRKYVMDVLKKKKELEQAENRKEP